jgi:hypothetical protein
MLECFVRANIVSHITANNLIENSQHGFVKGRSCATNLIEFLDYLTEILETGGTADAIFLDFAKAISPDRPNKNFFIADLCGVE